MLCMVIISELLMSTNDSIEENSNSLTQDVHYERESQSG